MTPYLAPLRLLLVLLALTAPLWSHGAEWSHTTPAINLTHIFQGEINKRGKPVGFHARPGGSDPQGVARLAQVTAGPNPAGVYTGQVAIHDPANDRWKEKFSSLYPDRLQRDEVVTLILNAYAHRKESGHGRWHGPSGQGFDIEGYLDDQGRINTAYPLFQRQ